MEILDSRGRPTLSVRLWLTEGAETWASVPSGASTGSGEAQELRDGDPDRYAGAGVTGAVANVNGEMRDALKDRPFADQADLDGYLIDLDGTVAKSRLGANAMVGVSMAVARALATSLGQPLWQSLRPEGVSSRLPIPCFNVLNGGVHADNPLAFQEFMAVPLGARSFREAVRAGAEIHRSLGKKIAEAGLSTGLGDEGGFAPDIASPQEALDLLVDAIGAAGYTTGPSGVMIALDPAASEFHDAERYLLGDQALSSSEMIALYEELLARYPIWSLEDPLGEADWSGWVEITRRLGDRVQLVGDDILVTNPKVISQAVTEGVGNAALIKVNQIGTVTETLEAMRICREAGYGQMVSHRSGETIDTFIADLAVGSGCGQIKAGAPARGERVAKYNRLMEIEAAGGLSYGPAPRR